MLLRAILLSAVLLCLAFAPAPFPKPRKFKGDLGALQGAWVLIWQDWGGVPDQVLKSTAVIEGARFKNFYAGKRTATYSLVLEERTNPKRFDMKDLDRPGIALVGVYSLEGDTLRMCYTWQRGERPLEFNSNKIRRVLAVYKRKR